MEFKPRNINPKPQRVVQERAAESYPKPEKKMEDSRTFELNLTLPDKFLTKKIPNVIKKILNRLHHVVKINKRVAIITIVLAVLVVITWNLPFVQSIVYPEDSAVSTKKGLNDGSRHFDIVLPKDKDIINSGWLNPPNGEPYFAYVDKIGDVPVRVSEQRLPERFKQDTVNKIAELAGEYSANEEVVVGDMVIHIGTNARGPQTVIFTKNNLLFLIKSEARISNKAWGKYVKLFE